MMQRDPVVTDVKLELSTPGIAVALATPLATVIARAKKLFEGCDCGDSQLSLTFGAVRFVRGTGAASNAGFVRGRVEDAVSRAVQQIVRPMNRQIGGARADSPDPFLRLLHWLTRIVDVPCGPLSALCVRRAIREPVTCTWLISGNIDGQPFTITVKIELIVMAHIFYYHNLQSLQRLPQYVSLPDPKRNSVPSPHSPTPECWDCERPLVLRHAENQQMSTGETAELGQGTAAASIDQRAVAAAANLVIWQIEVQGVPDDEFWARVSLRPAFVALQNL